ncbi:sodium/solute symporter [Luteolibacter luteus]|uniref:Sodium/solute symporter n=2 Tax=Luteolibacter luteus TaxID=2728835 RepID=A0A858RLH1_9BACT|nr:sodium/solute symporter [Luteolibacter luteus]QJE97575.1 sodium/solute symporter [Luteolibacter luteus]
MNLPFSLLAQASLEAGKMSTLDVILFIIVVVGVIAFGIWQGRKESADAAESGGAAGYFLAGRGLTWWLVGFSLIAANISTEQFVGMSGQAADWLGMAVSSWEWLSATALVLVAFVFLPKLLRCGIYTIPEFLEYRYGRFSRIVMAVATLIILVGVPTASVIYSGAKVISVFFQGRMVMGADLGDITIGCWIIGISAAIYVLVGGLKACAWTDLIWGAGLIAGGAVVTWLAFGALKDADPNQLILTKVQNSTATVSDLEAASGWGRFILLNDGKSGEAAAMAGENLSGGKLHMVRPIHDPELPWTVLLLGIWVPICFYWGLNQYIVQRTLGSKSLAEGQKGIIFAATLKLLIPFLIVIPGILCFNLYNKDLRAEAVKKNASTLLEMRGAPAKVYPFTGNFVAADTATAREILTHNANAAKMEIAIPTEATSDQLLELNKKVLEEAVTKQIPAGTKLIGYDYDAAFPTLMRNLMRPGLTWFVLAAIFGAVVSSLASMLNSAATIATMDLVHQVKKDMSEKSTVLSGQFFTLLFVLISCLIAPGLGDPKFGGIFKFIQEFQGYISPGVLAVFLFGFLSPRTPRYFGWVGILSNVVLYHSIKHWIGPILGKNGMWFAPDVSYVDRMGLCFLFVVALGLVVTLANPLSQPVKLPVTELISLESSKSTKVWGAIVIVATLILYAIFS